jgi:carboxyl-terminal processing protease
MSTDPAKATQVPEPGDTAPVPAAPTVPAPDLAAPDVAAPTVPLPDLVAPVAPAGRSGRRTSGAVIASCLIAVLTGGVLFVSGWSLGRQTAVTPGTPADETQLFQPFWDTYRAVTERYAGGDVDRKALVEGAIKGMIGALDDPYSQYLTAEEFKRSLEGISGQFEGIGATIGTVDAKGATSGCTDLGPECRMVIVAPIKGSPAEQAGLQPGDVIAKIDGVPVDGQKLDDARSKVRGAKGTVLVLAIVRGGGAPREISITRDVIVTPEVETEALADGTVGYIRLAGFSDRAADDFDAAVAADAKAGITRLIVDLRGNPGGFVTAARDIASQFLGDGTIFWQEDADGTLLETLAKPGGAAVDPKIKVMLLVDGGSASASEIVAGALHDRGRATLIGTKTFGKGTVQQWTQLEDDRGGFRLTIAKWLTPDKTWIHGKGIQPDITVDEQGQKPGDDPVLDRALQELGVGATGFVICGVAAA